MLRIRAELFYTSFPIDFPEAAALSFDLADLWFPHNIIADKSDFLVVSSIGDRWYWGPFWIM